jgi:hypothetical protein
MKTCWTSLPKKLSSGRKEFFDWPGPNPTTSTLIYKYNASVVLGT